MTSIELHPDDTNDITPGEKQPRAEYWNRFMSMNRLSTVIATGVLIGVSTSPLLGQYPTSPPDAMPMQQLQLPPFDEFQLPNGLDVVLVRDHSLPIVIVSLSMPGGSAHDPAGKEGLASLVADVMLKGTTNRSAEHLAAEIEGVGAGLNAGAGNDFFSLGTAVLKEHVNLAFELIGDVLLNATYPEEEVALSQQRSASAARVSESQPGFLAGKFFNAAVYGNDHPYGRTPTGSTIEAATRDDVEAFADTYLKPGGSVLVLAGDLTVDEARALTRQYLGEWQGRAAPAVSAANKAATATEIILVNRPGSSQSNILVGNLTMSPGDDDYYGAVVANRVLGGGGDARLFKILREDKGWTYGAYSSQNRPKGTGRFRANTEVRTEVTDSALTEILHQVRLMRTEPVPDEELLGAKGFLLGSFPLQIQTPQQVAAQVRTVRQLDLGQEYLSSYRSRLAAVDARTIMEVSQRLMKPDSAVIVVVGDGKEIYDGLAAIAPVRIIDADGSPLTVADLNPATEAIVFDVSRVTIRTDSFTVLFQGQEFGNATFSFSRSSVDGRETIVADRMMSIPAAGLREQASLVVDAETLTSLSYTSSGTNQLGASETAVTYADGRVAGTTSTPNAETQQIETHDVDTALESDVVDSNVLSMFAGSMPLADGASFAVSVFETSENAVGVRTIKVEDGGLVTVPAGEFEVWAVSVEGGQSWIYQVAKNTGQIVKMEVVGQPLSLVLVSSTGS